MSTSSVFENAPPRSGAKWTGALRPLLLLLSFTVGCASVSNPVGDGIPVRHLPTEVFGESKEALRPIPLTYLRQPPVGVYRLAPGDVLGVWIEGVLGEKNAPPPVRSGEQGRPPSSGYPIPVADDGTVSLPLLRPIQVRGMSLAQAQAEIIRVYTEEAKVLKAGRERVIVTLQEPRRYHILVAREDAGSTSVGSSGGFSGFSGGTVITETRRSAGFPLDLPAYENDVLNALKRSGGLPGFEAENEVVIQKSAPTGEAAGRPAEPAPIRIVRIPLRMRPGEPIPIRPEDVILETGDIVYVRNRRGEVFYTGGLLPPRVFPLPRDRDLDILEALTIVGAPLINGGLGVNNLSGTVVGGGFGQPSPSQVTILRKTEGCGQITIRVNLNRAFRDPRERIRVLPGDFIVLQETVLETLSRYTQGVLRFGFFGTTIRERDLNGTATLTLP
jgi:hypothetical protein